MSVAQVSISSRKSHATPSKAVAPVTVTDAAYDALIDASPHGSLFCRRWWLDAVAPGRLRLLTVERDAVIHAAWPLITSQRSTRSFGMPQLTQRLGVILRSGCGRYAESLSREHELIESLIAQLPPGASVSQQFHERFTNWLPFYWHGFTQSTRYTYLLTDLTDVQSLDRNMRAKTRNAIRRTARSGLTIVDDLPLERFLPLHDQTFARQHMTSPIPHELIRRLDRACQRHADRRIFAALDGNGNAHAALYLVWDHERAVYLMGASDPQRRESGALRWLIWQAIRFASTRTSMFDFEGSMIRPVEFVARGFGAVQTPYFVIQRAIPSPATIARTAGSQMKQYLRALINRRYRHSIASNGESER